MKSKRIKKSTLIIFHGAKTELLFAIKREI